MKRARVGRTARRLLALLLGAALLGGGTWWYAVRTLRTQIVAALGPGTEVGAVTLHAGHVAIERLRVAALAGWPAPDALSATRVVVLPEWRTLWSAHPRIARVSIEGAYLSVLRSGDGRVQVLPGLADLPPPVSSPGTAPVATEKQAPPKPASTQAAAPTLATAQPRPVPVSPAAGRVSIGLIRLQGAALDFFDATVARPPHRLRIEALSASVTDLTVPGLAGRSAVTVSGTVPAAPGRSPAKDGTLAIEGWIVPATRDSRLVGRLRHVDLVVLQPYLLRATDARVRGGSLDLDLVSEVGAGRLRAPGTVVLTGLELGPAKGGAATFMGLPRDAVRIDGVHNLHAASRGTELADDVERVVEVATNRDHLRSCGKGLEQLPCGDLPGREQYDRLDPRGGGVCGGGCGGVASTRADHGAGARLHGLRHSHHHAAILERSGWVRPLHLQPQVRCAN
jgi:hypothetical protein